MYELTSLCSLSALEDVFINWALYKCFLLIYLLAVSSFDDGQVYTKPIFFHYVTLIKIKGQI